MHTYGAHKNKQAHVRTYVHVNQNKNLKHLFKKNVARSILRRPASLGLSSLYKDLSNAVIKSPP